MVITLNAPSSSATASQIPPVLATLGNSEIVLLELQGEIEVEGDSRGKTAAILSLDDDGKGKPTLRIGHNLLEGKVVSLPKALAVLQRDRSTPPDLLDVHGSDDLPSLPDSQTYTIRAIVRKKLLFSKRPMPIVGSGMSAANGKPVSLTGRQSG
ncbi:hypothetical protein K488DRAFT_84818 [Vararia minispora EC-137]|uniref:Uncharacterized protein n=1 Tax=Vararia minispora EC-137 TaxID=1314806 RepID=A0ACB8QP40_9AGAM|nr:hypothetical protein K488DRAFT_84818 [Vararia minispora EC-137]